MRGGRGGSRFNGEEGRVWRGRVGAKGRGDCGGKGRRAGKGRELHQALVRNCEESKGHAAQSSTAQRYAAQSIIAQHCIVALGTHTFKVTWDSVQHSPAHLSVTCYSSSLLCQAELTHCCHAAAHCFS